MGKILLKNLPTNLFLKYFIINTKHKNALVKYVTCLCMNIPRETTLTKQEFGQISKNIFCLVFFRIFIVTCYDVLLATGKRESIEIISNMLL